MWTVARTLENEAVLNKIIGVRFDIKKDLLYPRFCQACLTGKTEQEMSEKDARCCIGCQQVVEAEYALSADNSGRKSRYVPVAHRENYVESPKTKKSTLNSTNAKVDNFGSRGRPKVYKKRPLPDEEIKQLHQQGMGAKAIASQLKRELGIIVSYKTIQRVLSGERKEGNSVKGDL